MINLNGHEYKTVYLDTNALSEFVNDTKYFTRNMLTKFIDGKHMFVTSFFNIVELNETQVDFKAKLKESLGIMPLGLLIPIEQVTVYEQQGIAIHNNLISFAVGAQPMFTVNLVDLFTMLDNEETKRLLSLRQSKLRNELADWQETRKIKNEKWQKSFYEYINKGIEKTVAYFPQPVDIKDLSVVKSLKISSYIKNMFIHSNSKDLLTSCIIDSYNAAYLAYVDVYVPERTVGAWLENAKSKFEFINDKIIYKISDFFDKE